MKKSSWIFLIFWGVVFLGLGIYLLIGRENGENQDLVRILVYLFVALLGMIAALIGSLRTEIRVLKKQVQQLEKSKQDDAND
ncbi:MAG: hypothetical protein FWD76_04105 [Firmicutes bacterium]|nr:hypothetical protein [Bacillota bacterium]